MSTILLSFEPYWFERLAKGTKFEYRKQWPKEPIKVYFYVSKPVKAICGVAYFGDREKLSDWLVKYKNRGSEVRERIEEYLRDCNWAIPVLSFQMTNRVYLEFLRRDLEKFIVPRMYYYVKENSELQIYLDEKLVPVGDIRYHSFDVIGDDEIC